VFAYYSTYEKIVLRRDIMNLQELEKELKIWEDYFKKSSQYLKPDEIRYSYNFMQYNKIKEMIQKLKGEENNGA
jgi:hypothetical protein